jgi:hypothetical protein
MGKKLPKERKQQRTILSLHNFHALNILRWKCTVEYIYQCPCYGDVYSHPTEGWNQCSSLLKWTQIPCADVDSEDEKWWKYMLSVLSRIYIYISVSFVVVPLLWRELLYCGLSYFYLFKYRDDSHLSYSAVQSHRTRCLHHQGDEGRTSVYFYKTILATTQKAATFLLTAVRTWNLTYSNCLPFYSLLERMGHCDFSWKNPKY